MNRLITRHFQSINNIALKMTRGTRIDADDLTQNTCIRLITKHDQYTVKANIHFLKFVKVVMSRTCLNMARSDQLSSRKIKAFIESKLFDDSSMIINDANLLYQAALKHLKNEYEHDVINMLLRGFKFREIADKYQKPVETIHARHRLVRKRLREAMS